MGKWQLRRSKKVGPFRLNLSKHGVSASAGVKGARLSANSKGELHRTTGLPGTGVYKRDKLGGLPAGQAASQTVNMQLLDATSGAADLSGSNPDIETLGVVDLGKHLAGVVGIASFAGLSAENPRGFRNAMLVPTGGQVAVYILVEPDDNPAQFSRKEKKAGQPHGRQVGRLSAKAARLLLEMTGGSDVLAVAYIDTQSEHIEVRVNRSELARDQNGTAPPPPNR